MDVLKVKLQKGGAAIGTLRRMGRSNLWILCLFR